MRLGSLLLMAVLALLGILPVVAAILLRQDIQGKGTGKMGAASNAAAVGGAFWSVVAGLIAMSRGVSLAWILVPVVLGIGLGGACAWRLPSGWKRGSRILGVVLFSTIPALLVAITAPSFSRVFLKSRSYEALRREVPEVAQLHNAPPEERARILDRVAKTLESGNTLVRLAALESLRTTPDSDNPYTAQIAPLINDSDENVRWAAACDLAESGNKGIAALREALPTASREGARAVRGALDRGAVVPGEEAILFSKMATNTALVAEARAAAAYAVGRAKPVPPEAAAELKAALNDADAGVRREATTALGLAGAGEGVFASAKTDSDPEVRTKAFYALSASTPVAAAHIPDLLRGAADPSPMVRTAAGQTMARLADWPPDVIAALIKLVDDSNRGASWAGLAGLSAAGPKAAPAVNRLTQLVNEADPQYEGMMAIGALGKMGPAAGAAVPDVRRWAKKNADKAHVAISFFVGVGEPGYAALPDLIGMLENGSDSVRNNAAHALGEMAAAPEAPQALPALEKARSDKAFGVKYLSEKSIEKIRKAHSL